MSFKQIYTNIINNNKKYVISKFPYFNADNAYKFAILNNSIPKRYSGSIGNLQALEQIKTILNNNNIIFSIDSFIKKTPINNVKFNNLIVDFKGISPNTIIIGAHHDSKFLPSLPNFTGANDGSSGVGLLLSLILYFNKITKTETLPLSLKFIFFDGEECFYNYSKNDGLFGSKHAAKLYHHTCKYMILLDMIGAKNLNIQFPKNSNKFLINTTFNIINKLNYSKYFNNKIRNSSIIDDTNPFENYNIPTINFIQMDYPYWHTNQDTIDKISKNSLEIIGNTTIQLLYNILQLYK